MRLDWCGHEAAKYAVENWHYSRCMPAGKLNKVGVWEGGKFIGCVIFGRGANQNAGRPYNLKTTEIAELVRVAMNVHHTPVSRIVAIALRFLAHQSPGLRLVFSYADPSQGHHGGIYQAGGWIYAGRTTGTHQAVLPDGTTAHKRTVFSRYGTNDLAKIGGHWVYPEAKHKYLMPLDPETRAKVLPLSKPYPKRAGSSASGTPPVQGGRGGATPTPAL